MSELANYKHATSAFKDAKERWNNFSSRLAESASWLNSTEQVHLFAQMKTKEEGPLRADEWPSADQVREEIKAVTDAREALAKAYEEIPEDQRSVVMPPSKQIARKGLLDNFRG
ncbi:hypothetical protein [Qipengyuania sp. SM2507]